MRNRIWSSSFCDINEIKNKKIIILEAGGKEMNSLSQEQYEGDIKEDDYYDLTTCRSRCLGGTSDCGVAGVNH